MVSLAEWPSILIERAYLRALRKQLAVTAPRIAIDLNDIRRDSASIRASAAALLCDDAAKAHLRIAATTLAAYRLLVSRTASRDEAIQALRKALYSAYRSFLGPAMAGLSFLLRQRVGSWLVRSLSPRRLDRLFGRGFAFETQLSDSMAELRVKTCLYHTFFTANGAAELTEIICHSDEAWIERLDPRRGVQFQRPETIGTGGEKCIFRFTNVKSRT